MTNMTLQEATELLEKGEKELNDIVYNLVISGHHDSKLIASTLKDLLAAQEKVTRAEIKGEKENRPIGFGDYVLIEMKRHGVPNEMYTHKVIGRSHSNCYVQVPIQQPAKEGLFGEMVEVLSVIQEGLVEDTVYKVRLCDVRLDLPVNTKEDERD